MNKDLEMILVLSGAIILFWFGMSILTAGRILYGSDASLLWASGMLTWLGIIGFSSFIFYLMGRNKE
ncbi:hypothetical protein LCGC14_0462070 [marine sediment metagenome]|uniref:Uncharacterized protein n=1 Tax=marine sediment metagenome TaxID=412755 RepID=A0A0F9VNK3_9ZZZZ